MRGKLLQKCEVKIGDTPSLFSPGLNHCPLGTIFQNVRFYVYLVGEYDEPDPSQELQPPVTLLGISRDQHAQGIGRAPDLGVKGRLVRQVHR